MRALEFIGVFGERRLKVQLYRPHGGGGIQVLINNYLEGTMEKVKGVWMAHLPRSSILTSADILIIQDILESADLKDFF
jgi:hypothetical protein